MTEFTNMVIEKIKTIPFGKVSTYGDIAFYAGNPKAARQVSYILHSCGEKNNLPWHRVIGKNAKIRINDLESKNLQAELLRSEGVFVDENYTVNLNEFSWQEN